MRWGILPEVEYEAEINRSELRPGVPSNVNTDIMQTMLSCFQRENMSAMTMIQFLAEKKEKSRQDLRLGGE